MWEISTNNVCNKFHFIIFSSSCHLLLASGDTVDEHFIKINILTRINLKKMIISLNYVFHVIPMRQYQFYLFFNTIN